MSKYEIEHPAVVFDEDQDPETRGQRYLLDAIDIALQSGVVATKMDFCSNAEAIHRGRSYGSPAGWATSPEALIKYKSPMVDIEINIKQTTQLDFVSEQDPQLEITLNELHDGHECPLCGEEFDTVVWENVTDFGKNDTAEWVYECPSDCDGSVILQNC